MITTEQRTSEGGGTNEQTAVGTPMTEYNYVEWVHIPEKVGNILFPAYRHPTDVADIDESFGSEYCDQQITF